MKKIIPFAEWMLFIFITTLALAPICAAKWYHTGDGPFHLYNAAILNDILFHSGRTFGHFYDLHITPVPNTSILVLQALMLEFLHPNIALMFSILIILMGIILGYLYFIKSINPDHKGISLLILPLVINLFIVMGFFSFLASLALMFVTIGYFNKDANQLKRNQIIIIASLITLNWFTHFIGALFSIGYIGIYWVLMGKGRLQMIKMLLIVSIPFVLLSLLFGKDATKSNALLFESFPTLLALFRDTAPLICYHSDELHFMNYFQYSILILFPFSLFYSYKKGAKLISFTPLVFCFLLIIAFFIAPSYCLSFKFINYRILFCAILFFCAFIESYSPRYTMILTIPVVIFILVKKNNFQTPIIEGYSKEIESIIKNTESLPKGKAVVAMNYSNNWLHYNICLYPATANKIIILDNEEASSVNSIIRWKKEKMPGQNIGNTISSNRPKLKLDYEKDANEKIAGVLRWQYNRDYSDTATKYTDSMLSINFTELENKNGVRTYLRK
jgi:hypothetical protein